MFFFHLQASEMAILTESYVCETFSTANLISRLPQNNISIAAAVTLIHNLVSSPTLASIEPSCARSALNVIESAMGVQQSDIGLLKNGIVRVAAAASFAIGWLASGGLTPGEIMTIQLNSTVYTLTRAASISALGSGASLPTLDSTVVTFPKSLASAADVAPSVAIDVQIQSRDPLFISRTFPWMQNLTAVSSVLSISLAADGETVPLVLQPLAEPVAIVLKLMQEVILPCHALVSRLHTCTEA
jgi:hypothetical protein